MTTRPGYIKDSLGNWIQIGPVVPVGSTVYYQDSAPASPQTGDIWIDSDYDVPSVDSSQFLRWRKTVSGGQTSLSGNDDTGLSLSYTPGYEQVYLNGVLLVRSQDYTATTGTTITGLTALAASDVVEVFSVLARVVGDVYTQSQTNSLLDTKSPVSTTGLVLISSTTFTSSSGVQINNCFSSSYENYKIVLSNLTATAGALLRYRMSSSGTPVSTSSYSFQRHYTQSTSTGGERTSGVTSGAFTYVGTGALNFTLVEVMNPFLSTITKTISNSSYSDATYPYYIDIFNGYHSTSSSYDGIYIFPESGNITGTIKIYGYK